MNDPIQKKPQPELTRPQTKPEEEKKKTRKSLVKIALVVVTIIIIILLLLHSCSPKPVAPPATDSKPGITIDGNAEDGGHEVTDQSAIEADLNAKVEASMINISMNMSPIFENSKADGNLMIVNDESNNYPQVIEIYKEGTEELIYKSGAIPVGSKIQSAPLSVELPKGEYKCIAYFNAVDLESGDILGKAAANIVITVEN